MTGFLIEINKDLSYPCLVSSVYTVFHYLQIYSKYSAIYMFHVLYNSMSLPYTAVSEKWFSA